MDKLRPEDLLSLEAYHKERSAFRAQVLAHKRDRQAAVGPNVTLYFEDRFTMQYQIQEMLRAERIYESEAIAEELAAYNPLIPDGSNLKATMMLEYTDVAERRVALEALAGVEQTVYLEVGNLGRVFAHADEDMPRSNDVEDRGRSLPALRARRRDVRAAQERGAAAHRCRPFALRPRAGSTSCDRAGARRRSEVILRSPRSANSLQSRRASRQLAQCGRSSASPAR